MKSLTDAVSALALLASLLLVTACGSMPDRPAGKDASSASDIRGALLVIRLAERPDPPPILQVDVAPAAGGQMTSLSARRQQSLPGSRADYFVALALPPQRYLLTAIREGASTPDAQGEPLAAPNLPFEVKAGTPAYLGRLVLRLGTALSGSLEIHDRYDDDTLFFRTSLPALRELTIPRDLLQVNTGPATPAGRQLSMDTVDAAVGRTLPGPARDAFQKYMKSKVPRAFAIHASDTRSFAYVSGERAVERAMKECSKRAAGAACRLFAVDDTVVSSLSCRDEGAPHNPNQTCGTATAGKSP